eukprot:8849949-Prorocentrum_lima.AAC.1
MAASIKYGAANVFLPTKQCKCSACLTRAGNQVRAHGKGRNTPMHASCPKQARKCSVCPARDAQKCPV